MSNSVGMASFRRFFLRLKVPLSAGFMNWFCGEVVLAQGQLCDLAKVSLQIQVVPPCIDPPFVAPVYRKK